MPLVLRKLLYLTNSCTIKLGYHRNSSLYHLRTKPPYNKRSISPDWAESSESSLPASIVHHDNHRKANFRVARVSMTLLRACVAALPRAMYVGTRRPPAAPKHVQYDAVPPGPPRRGIYLCFETVPNSCRGAQLQSRS